MGFCRIYSQLLHKGGIAQLVERLVRNDFLGFCDSLGLLWRVFNERAVEVEANTRQKQRS